MLSNKPNFSLAVFRPQPQIGHTANSLIGTMAAFDSTARKQAPPEPTFRTAPHNIEAEQALLGRNSGQ